MGPLATVFALAGLASAALPGTFMYVGLGCGIAATGLGIVGYRQKNTAPRVRLLAAAGVAVGGIATVLGGARIVLTLMTIDHLESLLR